MQKELLLILDKFDKAIDVHFKNDELSYEQQENLDKALDNLVNAVHYNTK